MPSTSQRMKRYHKPLRRRYVRLDMDFYCTIRSRGGSQLGFLCGPFRTTNAAYKRVRTARERAIELDGWAAFHTFGVAAVPRGSAIKTVFPIT